jgi:hypothetical protein
MKPRTYFRLALLFPYMLWCIGALIVFVLSSQNISDAWNVVLMPISFYTFGILLWFVPYTLLAGGMWIWSRNKSTTALHKVAVLAPLMLFALMLLEVILVMLPTSSITEITNGLLGQVALVGGTSLFFGYLCVGVALGVYKFLQAKHRITEGSMSNNELLSSEI